jgi:hypothetical protein
LAGHRSKRELAVETTPDVCVCLSRGIAQSDEDIRKLIDSWVVPRLIQAFVDEATNRAVQTETLKHANEADDFAKQATEAQL